MDYLNSKDAALELDTDILDDMGSYKEWITKMAAKHINSTRRLYQAVRELPAQKMSIESSKWAKEHGGDFGELVAPELELVDWSEVRRLV